MVGLFCNPEPCNALYTHAVADNHQVVIKPLETVTQTQEGTMEALLQPLSTATVVLTPDRRRKQQNPSPGRVETTSTLAPASGLQYSYSDAVVLYY